MTMRVARLGAVAAGLALAACNPTGDTGYVEIRTVPAVSQRSPSLYLDATKLGPVQKGVAVLKQRPGTKVLFISGYSGELIAHRGILDAGVDYLPKPFTPDSLVAKVLEVLGADRPKSQGA